MCCLVTVLVFLGPRALILIWWLVEPLRWQQTFNTVLLPVLGFLFLPWTTLVYVLVAPGGVVGVDWFVLGIAFLADLAAYAGGGYGNRGRVSSFAR
jgi:hypothetical protein